MVISDSYKYIYVELYFTGTTSIRNELIELYQGKAILKKHAKYHTFLQTASKDQKNYFVFSGIRNPMDMVVSEYLKLKNDPYERFKKEGSSDHKKAKIYKKINTENLSFQQYFKENYKLPYDNWSSLSHSKFDYIIKFENIQNDFREVLERLNIPQKRPLPVRNKTKEKEHFLNYYTPEIREKAIFIFGPFMKKWGYSFPAEWNVKKVSWLSELLFNALKIVRNVYWKFR